MRIAGTLCALAGLALLAACEPATKSAGESTLSANPQTSPESSPNPGPEMQPPMAARRPHKVESPNGARDDEYYWLRDDTRSNKDVLAYLQAENAYADAQLAHTKPLQAKLYKEMIGRIKLDDASVPFIERGYWYYVRYDTGSEYPIYARKRGELSAPEQIMLDVNRMAQGHEFFQVGDWVVSHDNRLIAWAEDVVGRRQFRLRVKNLETGEVLTDIVENIEPNLVWAADDRTLLYVAKDPVTLLGDKVKKHVLGSEAARDALVYAEKDDAFYMGVGETKDEGYLTIKVSSTVSTEIQVARSDDPSLMFRVLIPRERNHEYDAEHLGNSWIIRTNWKAKNFRVVAAAQDSPADREAWRDLIAHRDDAFIDACDVFRDFVAVEEHSNGLANVRIQPLSGGAGPHAATGKSYVVDSDEPAYSTALGTNVEIDARKVRYVYTSLTTPRSTYDLDTRTGKRELLKQDEVRGGFDHANYVTEHVWANARDGARVPVSIVRRRSVAKDGTAPLLQYGYGSYGIPSDPEFSHSIISLLDRGFVYAIAHIRGGQEMGRAWYENGRLLKKMNTFDDFVDVTRFLVKERYAAHDKVFALGGSAGGLLMGAVMNAAPQDYRGIVALVPFVDVVTTMLDETIPLTTNEFDEWGNPKEKPYYDYMLTYSPYDNVKAQAYPALFVRTGLWDSQVQYYEPSKWVARLRRMKTDSNTLLYRVNMEAGHGGKSGRFQRYHEIAEYYAFLIDQAGR
uniref:Protease II n=1 Tax=uncultured bacterium BLR8 TaxID=506524 RepID=C0IN87_9BACT|nr:protease II [uncultured bacterium BLR8]